MAKKTPHPARITERDLEETFRPLLCCNPPRGHRRRNDVFDERAAEATDAPPEARAAAAEIARALDLRGASDPAHIANLIHAEMLSFELDPDADVIETDWPGLDAVTGLYAREMHYIVTRAAMPAGVDPITAKAARSSAIRIARAYGDAIEQAAPRDLRDQDAFDEFLNIAPGRIAEHLTRDTAHARIADVEAALREIQAHRRRLGMPILDVHAAGWTEQDVILEAERIRTLPNPMADLKHRLI